MVHVFTDNIIDSTAVITGQDAHHIIHVLRMKEGDEICVSSGTGLDYLCSVSSFSENEVTARIIEARKSTELPVEIVLYQGLPKSDKMELIIQKCTELGVSRIVPVQTRRSIVKLDAASSAKKLERWRKIAQSASEQSQRSRIPQIDPVCTLQDALRDSTSLSAAIIPYEHEYGGSGLKSFLTSVSGLSSAGIFIGPEGGFEEEEISQARSAGAIPVSLGSRILRTETAGLAVISAIMLICESQL